MDTTAVDTYTVKLDKITVGLRFIASRHFIDSAVSYEQYIYDSVEFKLKGYLLGENIETYLYPRNWWEALKKELFDLPFFPSFLKSPIKYKEIVVQAVYPDFRPSLTGQRYITTSYLRDGEWS